MAEGYIDVPNTIDSVPFTSNYSGTTSAYRIGKLCIFRINHYGNAIAKDTVIATLTNDTAKYACTGAIGGIDDNLGGALEIRGNDNKITVSAIPQNKRYQGELVFILN